jgi:hypothetical protein
MENEVFRDLFEVLGSALECKYRSERIEGQ